MKRTALKRGTKQMKRTGFKQKSYQEVVDAQKAKKSRSQGRTVAQKKNKKVTKKGYKPPKWMNVIPYGTHGSNPVQKRLWKLTSDYVRISDFYNYYQSCVSCSHVFVDWSGAQCGHFKAWGASNSFFKYNIKNLAAQCASCNHRDDGPIGHAFGEELKRRHGKDIIKWIEEENQVYRGQKLEVITLVEMARKLVDMIDELPDQPPYWPDLKRRLAEHEQEML